MISAHDRLSACVELCRRHGFGRIEVANLAQIAHTMLYFRPQDEVVAAAEAATEAAARVGHLRAELNARVAAVFALFNLAEVGRAWSRSSGRKPSSAASAPGASRPVCLRCLGRVALQRRPARRGRVSCCARRSSVCRRTGITFEGPRALSALALAVADPAERRALLAEGEAIIRGGCVGHNPLFFYPDAIEVCLELGEPGEAERHAAALEDYTRPEPLPWADFYIARGRALADLGRGLRDTGLLATLRRLRDEAGRLGLRVAEPRIDTALAGA